MMQTKTLILYLLPLTLLFSSCSIFNPYESEFSCKSASSGECMSIQKAYQKALSSEGAEKEDESTMMETAYFHKRYRYVKNPFGINAAAPSKILVYDYEPVKIKRNLPKEDPRVMYEKNKFQTLGKLLSEKEAPLVAPPKVLKVLIFPYSSGERSEVLNMHRYVFVKVEESEWVFDPLEVN